jgi:hypothetical protein
MVVNFTEFPLSQATVQAPRPGHLPGVRTSYNILRKFIASYCPKEIMERVKSTPTNKEVAIAVKKPREANHTELNRLSSSA